MSIRTRFIKRTLADLQLETTNDIVVKIESEFKDAHLHQIMEEDIEEKYYQLKRRQIK